MVMIVVTSRFRRRGGTAFKTAGLAQRFSQQKFNMGIYASEFVAGPLLNRLINFRVEPERERFAFFGHDG